MAISLLAPIAADDGRAPSRAAARITALDGLRGVASLMVLLSHYFSELPGGIAALGVGWIGVDIFFVLSGFLIGRLILERQHHANFFTVFYVRRFWRIIPAYVLTVLAVTALFGGSGAGWSRSAVTFPTWSYLAFLQGGWMTMTNSIGAHWLAPTWTLAVEEHFYLLAPAAMILLPRKVLVPALVATVALALGFRGAAIVSGPMLRMAGLVLLPGRADLLACGILAAIAYRARPELGAAFLVRLAPLLALVATFAIEARGGSIAYVLAPTIMAIGCACLILAIAADAPEAATLRSRVLRFFGDNAYCTYLVHLPILAAVHGLVLDAGPALTGPAQWVLTIGSLAAAILAGWVMTKAVEEPLTAFGRRWAWSKPEAARAPINSYGVPAGQLSAG